jgi:transketolase N-terminal domain/subunit
MLIQPILDYNKCRKQVLGWVNSFGLDINVPKIVPKKNIENDFNAIGLEVMDINEK